MPSSSPLVSDEPEPRPEPHADTSGPKRDEQDPPARTQAAKHNRSDPGKVPKWLKLPGEEGAGRGAGWKRSAVCDHLLVLLQLMLKNKSFVSCGGPVRKLLIVSFS